MSNNLTGEASNTIESLQFQNINTETINNKSIAQYTDIETLQLEVITLQNTVNTLVEFINTHFEKEFQNV